MIREESIKIERDRIRIRNLYGGNYMKKPIWMKLYEKT
jgi:hypothetical protein